MQEPLQFPFHRGRNRFRESGICTFLFPEGVLPRKNLSCRDSKVSELEAFPSVSSYSVQCQDSRKANDAAIATQVDRAYRLPSKAEWEFACRAGTMSQLFSGDSSEDLMQAGWFNSSSGEKTHSVG